MRYIIFGKVVIDVLILGGISLFLLIIGFRGIIKMKPFLISSKWVVSLIVIALLSNVFDSFLLPKHQSGGFGINSIIILIIAWLYMHSLLIKRQTYITYGVTNGLLRESLHSVLKKMNIESEETLRSIRLPSKLAEFQVYMLSWAGIGMINIKDRKDNKLFHEIVNSLNVYFQETKIKINVGIFIFNIILGIFLMMFSVLALHTLNIIILQNKI